MTFISDFKKPINIIPLIIGILGIVLSFFFYFDGKKVKNVSYSLPETPSLIFDSKNSSSAIKLYEKDTVLISRNVYLLTGMIWNSGNLPIDKSDIRVPITLVLDKSNRILDFKIIKQKDSSIANFVLSKTNNNILSLDWRYFDPHFGISFQIIYEGDVTHSFQLKGKILDVSNFLQEKINNKPKSLWSWDFILILSFLILFLIIAIIESTKKGKPDRSTIFLV
ncbi:MAG: hypothetical protein IPQ06_11165, partial [Chitinophagaceae bacterium]|nr:hypothetical protein [Chitinophagaceae bacterium]